MKMSARCALDQSDTSTQKIKLYMYVQTIRNSFATRLCYAVTVWTFRLLEYCTTIETTQSHIHQTDSAGVARPRVIAIAEIPIHLINDGCFSFAYETIYWVFCCFDVRKREKNAMQSFVCDTIKSHGFLFCSFLFLKNKQFKWIKNNIRWVSSWVGRKAQCYCYCLLRLETNVYVWTGWLNHLESVCESNRSVMLPKK